MMKRSIATFLLVLGALIATSFGIFGVALLVASDTGGVSQFDYIYSIIMFSASFVTGAGTVALAVAAFLGIEAWKKQLVYKTHLDIIWECVSALRDLQRAKMEWYIYAYTDAVSPEESMLEDFRRRDLELESSIGRLKLGFSSMDTLVARNQWQWANYSMDVLTEIASLKGEFRQYKDQPDGEDLLNSRLLRINNEFDRKANWLHNELVVVESNYIRL